MEMAELENNSGLANRELFMENINKIANNFNIANFLVDIL